MMDTTDKIGLTAFLKDLDENVFWELFRITTKKERLESIDKAISYICLNSQSVNEVLGRQIIHRDIIRDYLLENDVSFNPTANKTEFINCLIKFMKGSHVDSAGQSSTTATEINSKKKTGKKSLTPKDNTKGRKSNEDGEKQKKDDGAKSFDEKTSEKKDDAKTKGSTGCKPKDLTSMKKTDKSKLKNNTFSMEVTHIKVHQNSPSKSNVDEVITGNTSVNKEPVEENDVKRSEGNEVKIKASGPGKSLKKKSNVNKRNPDTDGGVRKQKIGAKSCDNKASVKKNDPEAGANNSDAVKPKDSTTNMNEKEKDKTNKKPK